MTTHYDGILSRTPGRVVCRRVQAPRALRTTKLWGRADCASCKVRLIKLIVVHDVGWPKVGEIYTVGSSRVWLLWVRPERGEPADDWVSYDLLDRFRISGQPR